jgi:Tfp pilus assembly protein PilN
MNSRNLIPLQRQTVKSRQRAVRRWLFINGIYLVILVAVGAVYAATVRSGDDDAQPSTLVSQTREIPADIPGLTREVTLLRTHLRSMREVTDRPDWSILLAAISETLGDDVVLDAVDCTDGGSGMSKSVVSNGALPEAFQIAGIGQSQNSVTRFVVAVEELQFFSQVRLVQTAPQTLRGRECVGFEIVCTVPRNTTGAK